MQTKKLSAAEREAIAQITSIPKQDDSLVFNAPWEAEAFAMTITLHQQGVFTWTEWASELSEKIVLAQENGDPDLGITYYLHWLAALESLVVKKELGKASALAQLYNEWEHAANITPHGQPIVLKK